MKLAVLYSALFESCLKESIDIKETVQPKSESGHYSPSCCSKLIIYLSIFNETQKEIFDRMSELLFTTKVDGKLHLKTDKIHQKKSI